jgi:hypothetical protein
LLCRAKKSVKSVESVEFVISTWLHRLYCFAMQGKEICEICWICWVNIINVSAQIKLFYYAGQGICEICWIRWAIFFNMIIQIKLFYYAGQGYLWNLLSLYSMWVHGLCNREQSTTNQADGFILYSPLAHQLRCLLFFFLILLILANLNKKIRNQSAVTLIPNCTLLCDTLFL